MPKAKVYNQEGQSVGEKTLPAEIFEVEVKEGLIQQAVELYLANQRKVYAHTKGRSEVRGGGRKPWRQKGTGRARHGSIRSPLWKGGGITFGPTKEASYKKKMNKKARRKALFMALSDKVKNEHLIIIDKIDIEKSKTKEFKNIVDKVGKAVAKEQTDKKVKNSYLVVIDPKNKPLFQASRNLAKIKVLSATSLNIYEILKYHWVFVTEKGLENVLKAFAAATSEKAKAKEVEKK